MKVDIGPDGKFYTYGLSGEETKNYRKYGQYVRDDELPHWSIRWLYRLFG